MNAEALTTAILDILQSHGIDYKEKLTGEGYDGNEWQLGWQRRHDMHTIYTAMLVD